MNTGIIIGIVIMAIILGIAIYLNWLAGEQVHQARIILDTIEEEECHLCEIKDLIEVSTCARPTHYSLRHCTANMWPEYRIWAYYPEGIGYPAYHKLVKAFPYHPKDKDEKDYARICAEELIDTLNDK